MKSDARERAPTSAITPVIPSRNGGIAFAAALSFAFLAYLRKINDSDYWTHLALGRAFVEARSIFIPEPFLEGARVGGGELRTGLASLVEALVRSSEWPFQLLVHSVRALLGDAGVSVLVAVAGLVATALLARPLLRMASPERLSIAAALVAGAIYTARFRFSPRPEVLATVLLVLVLDLAFRWGENPRWRVLAALAGLLLAWMPLHVTWTLGVAWCGIAIASRPRLDFWRRQRLVARAAAVVVALAAVAAAGRFAWLVLRELRGDGVLVAVTEMRPTWEFPSLLGPFCAVALAALGVSLGGSEGRLARLATWGSAVLVGLLVVRNVGFAVLAMMPGALRGLSQFPPRRSDRRRAAVTSLAAASLMAALMGSMLRDRDYPFGIGVDWRHFPRRAAQYVRDAPLESPVFNSWAWGGYLDWAWNGNPRTFLDGRGGDASVLSDHLEVMSGEPGPVLRRYGFRTAIIQPVFLNSGRLAPAVRWFLHNPEWRLVQATDGLVFARVPLPSGVVEVPLDGAWRVVLDWANLASEQNDLAPHASFTRAVALMQLGDRRGALAAFEEGRRRSPETAIEYQGLGPILRSLAGS